MLHRFPVTDAQAQFKNDCEWILRYHAAYSVSYFSSFWRHFHAYRLAPNVSQFTLFPPAKHTANSSQKHWGKVKVTWYWTNEFLIYSQSGYSQNSCIILWSVLAAKAVTCTTTGSLCFIMILNLPRILHLWLHAFLHFGACVLSLLQLRSSGCGTEDSEAMAEPWRQLRPGVDK